MGEGNPAGRVIVQGARTTALGFAIRFGARLLFLYIAARLFGVVLFGAYSLAVAVIELAVTAGGLGSKRILFKRMEDEQDRLPIHVILDQAVLVGTTSLVLAGAIMLAVATAPPSMIAGNVGAALFILGPMIAGQALLDLFLAGTRWTHNIRYEVVSRSIVEPYAGVAAAIAAYLLGWREIGLLIGYWAGTLAALAYALIGVRRCFGGFDLKAWRFAPNGLLPLLRISAGATLNDFLTGFFARVDLYLVGIMLGEAAAGIYGMARQVRTPIRQVRQSFDGLLNPIIARTLALKGPAITAAATASAARLILALQLPILIVLLLGGMPLLRWFGPGFDAGYQALLILAAAEAIQGAFGVSDLIILYRHPMALLRITSANIAFNLLAGWLLIERWGVTGAALSVLAGVTAGALIRRATMRHYFGVSTPYLHSAGPIAAAALATGVGLAFMRWLPASLPLVYYGSCLIAGLLTYAAALKLWLQVTRDDLSLKEFQTMADGAVPVSPMTRS